MGTAGSARGTGTRGVTVRLLVALALATPAPAPSGSARAENVDPDAAGEQYAWGENVGWINAQPLGPAGPGMQVDDFRLSGWAWAENAGWINLTCANRDTCDDADWGVANDGRGRLAGFAWSENLGWIDFGPPGAGVTIDPVTGGFEGHAWAENAGWINFGPAAASGPSAIRTAWRCAPVPPSPPAASGLVVARTAASTVLSWPEVAGASGYDVIRGTVLALLAQGGDFAAAGLTCIARKQPGTEYAEPDMVGEPLPGDAFWYLVRAANCGGAGTYDDGGPGLASPRDARIGTSGCDCR